MLKNRIQTSYKKKVHNLRIREHDQMITEIQLPNQKLEEKLNEAIENGDFEGAEVNILKMQAHFLSAVNDENRNILHLGCYRGNLKLV